MLDKLMHKIKRKQVEIQGLRDDLVHIQDKIKQEERYLQALEDARRMMDTKGKDSDGEHEPVATVALKDGSDMAKVREVLKAAGKPLHIKDIMTRMGKPFEPSIRASLVGSLGQYVRNNRVFKRTGPNIFGLIEGSDSGKDDDSEESEPEAAHNMKRVRLIR